MLQIPVVTFFYIKLIKLEIGWIRERSVAQYNGFIRASEREHRPDILRLYFDRLISADTTVIHSNQPHRPGEYLFFQTLCVHKYRGLNISRINPSSRLLQRGADRIFVYMEEYLERDAVIERKVNLENWEWLSRKHLERSLDSKELFQEDNYSSNELNPSQGRWSNQSCNRFLG